MSETLLKVTPESVEHHLPYDYRPDKPRVIAPLDKASREKIDPLYDGLDKYLNRLYRHIPGWQAATLCDPHLLYPYIPDAQTRTRMAQSRFYAINAVAEHELQFVEVKTRGLIINSHEGVPVISLALDSDDTTVIRDTTKESMTRTFSQLAEGGTVVDDGYRWLDKVHDLSFSYLPLARLPRGNRAVGSYCIDQIQDLTPHSLRISTVPRIYADLEGPLELLEDRRANRETINFTEADIVQRAIRAAAEYPEAEVTLAINPDYSLGKLVLPDNLLVDFINNDAGYMKICF